MVDEWFISDTHFGHKNILEYEKNARPFSSLEEMHEVMIDRWNSVVKPNDKVYHLGDVAFNAEGLFVMKRLNGIKTLIMGNHDNMQTTHMFNKFYGVKFHHEFILTHVPVHDNHVGKRCLFNLHGHLHSRNVGTPYHFNVSCEQNNLTPFHLDQIRELIGCAPY